MQFQRSFQLCRRFALQRAIEGKVVKPCQYTKALDSPFLSISNIRLQRRSFNTFSDDYNSDLRRAIDVDNNIMVTKTPSSGYSDKDCSDKVEDWSKAKINLHRGLYRELVYFMTGKKDGTLDDYMNLSETDLRAEAAILMPQRFGGKILGRAILNTKRSDSNSKLSKSLAFFSGKAYFFNNLYEFEKAWIDTQKSARQVRRNDMTSNQEYFWLKKPQMETAVGGVLTNDEYEELISYLEAISQSGYGRTEYKVLLKAYMGPPRNDGFKGKLAPMNKFGKIKTKGSNKVARAVINLSKADSPDEAHIMVNHQPMAQYIKKVKDRQILIDPLVTVGELGTFTITCNVRGGGQTSQARAIRLAITRALHGYDPEKFYDPLDSLDLFIRDPRHRERKKPGRKGARAMKQWVKR